VWCLQHQKTAPVPSVRMIFSDTTPIEIPFVPSPKTSATPIIKADRTIRTGKSTARFQISEIIRCLAHGTTYCQTENSFYSLQKCCKKLKKEPPERIKLLGSRCGM